MKVFSICAVIFGFCSSASAWEESTAIAELFKANGARGTFVVDTQGKLIGHDEQRAKKRYVPASTFKIPNSLIGLSTSAVESVDEAIPYRGDPHPFMKEWARDMSLRDAIKLSNVPIYQELARRIGITRMRDAVTALEYGSAEIGSTVDRFWLDGPLKISAIEQTRFLRKLADGALPFPLQHQKSVGEITQLESGLGWSLHGKTGWENAPNRGIGWWVGWVQRGGDVHAFALNMDIENADDAKKRVTLGRSCLTALGLLDPER